MQQGNHHSNQWDLKLSPSIKGDKVLYLVWDLWDLLGNDLTHRLQYSQQVPPRHVQKMKSTNTVRYATLAAFGVLSKYGQEQNGYHFG